MYNEEWFTSRGKYKLDFQETTINKVLVSLEENEITVLAACPSAGKTIMAIYTLEVYCKKHPDHKAIVLAHATCVLRSQFYEVCEMLNKIKPLGFTYKLVESKADYDKNVQVNITLPQTIHKGKIEHADLIVNDEGHEYYFAKGKDGRDGMIQKIIKESGATKQLILTGAPGKFILRKIPIIPVTINQIMDSGMIANLNIELACSNYDFKLEKFDCEGNLIGEDFDKKDTEKTLDHLLKYVVRRLKTRSIHQYVNFTRNGWFGALREMKKTMVACRSQKQAVQVKKYFESQNIKVKLSISEITGSNQEIENFQKEKDCLVLIVVQRGILGFNYPDLINVIDLTLSYNINRVFELMCRTIRKNPTNDTKLFFKIAPAHLGPYYKYIMEAVLCMSQEEFYTKFNGKNLSEMEIPVIKTTKKKKRGQGTGKKRKNVGKPIMYDDLRLFNAFDLIRSIYHKGDKILEGYGWATMQDVRNQFLKNYSYTKEEIHEDALRFNSIMVWADSSKESGKMYRQAKYNGWLKEVTSHMINLNGIRVKYTKEEIFQDALKYKTISEWMTSEKFRAMYNQARINGWFEEITSHMSKVNRFTKEEIHQDALRFKLPSTWSGSSKNSRSMYTKAVNKGWLKEVTSHMINKLNNKPHSKEEIHQDALKFKSISEWIKESGTMYRYAGSKGWVKEVTSHMRLNKIERRKELIHQDALKFNKVSEWQRNSRYMFIEAKRNDWYQEVTAHMKRPKAQIK